MPTLQPEDGHLSRTEGFRYEDKVVNGAEAFELASARSLKTAKVITVMKSDSGEGYVIHSHGIDMTGFTVVARFHRGQKTL